MENVGHEYPIAFYTEDDLEWTFDHSAVAKAEVLQHVLLLVCMSDGQLIAISP